MSFETKKVNEIQNMELDQKSFDPKSLEEGGCEMSLDEPTSTDRYLTFRCSDGKELKVLYKYAMISKILKEAEELDKDFRTGDNQVFDFSKYKGHENANSKTIGYIVEWMNLCKGTDAPLPVKSTNKVFANPLDSGEAWCFEFVGKLHDVPNNMGVFRDVMDVACWMDVRSLFEYCRSIARCILKTEIAVPIVVLDESNRILNERYGTPEIPLEEYPEGLWELNFGRKDRVEPFVGVERAFERERTYPADRKKIPQKNVQTKFTAGHFYLIQEAARNVLARGFPSEPWLDTKPMRKMYKEYLENPTRYQVSFWCWKLDRAKYFYDGIDEDLPRDDGEDDDDEGNTEKKPSEEAKEVKQQDDDRKMDQSL